MVSVFTPNQADWLRLHFDANLPNFFAPMADHADWLLFYPIYPLDASAQLHSLLTQQANVSLISPLPGQIPHPSSDLRGRLRALGYPHDVDALREYLTPHGVHIITVPLVINLPRYLQRGRRPPPAS